MSHGMLGLATRERQPSNADTGDEHEGNATGLTRGIRPNVVLFCSAGVHLNESWKLHRLGRISFRFAQDIRADVLTRCRHCTSSRSWSHFVSASTAWACRAKWPRRSLV